MSLRVIAAVAAGVIYGFSQSGRLPPAALSLVETVALAVVLFSAGVEMGRQWRRIVVILRRGWVTFATPIAVVVGTLLGGILAAVTARIGVAEALAISGSFGWYSLAGVVLTSAAGPTVGALGFLANVLREVTAMTLIPLLTRRLGRESAVAAAGATAMDTSLGILVRYGGVRSGSIGLVSGVLLSALAPLFLAFFSVRL